MKRFLAVLVLLSASSVAFADDPPPPEPTPKMEPEKVGPRTEKVDEKAYAKVVRVGPGESITNALAAITDAAEGKRYAITVAAGTYKGETIAMKPFVDLFGGFDAKDSAKRDIDANRTILDGEGQRRVVVGADNARLDGFVVTNGKVRGPGAGVLCDHAAPTISNNTIVNNATAGPEGVHQEMYHQHGNDGAGVACVNAAHATVTNNVIAHNTTDIGNGGGVAAANWSMPHVTNNVIVNNRTGLTDVKSRSSNGAGVSASNAVIRPPHRMTVVNNVIANNYAGGNSDAGGVYCEYDASPVVGGNWVLANYAEDDGSGVYIMKLSEPILAGNVIAGHVKGAIRLSKQGVAEIRDNLIFGNGGAITSISAWMNLKNNTIVDNASGVGHENTYAPYIKAPVVSGNLIYRNGGGGGGGGGQFGAPGTGEDAPRVTNNDIQGGYKAGEGNFDEKPQFAEAGAGGEGTASSVTYDDLRGVSVIACSSVSGPEKNYEEARGRVVSLGERWGVIKSAGGDKITVWGDLRPKDGAPTPTQLKIWPTYRLKTPLPGSVGGALVQP